MGSRARAGALRVEGQGNETPQGSLTSKHQNLCVKEEGCTGSLNLELGSVRRQAESEAFTLLA